MANAFSTTVSDWVNVDNEISLIEDGILELGTEKTNNLFNQINISGFISNSGEVVPDVNWKHSDYIPVIQNTFLSGILIGYRTNLVSVIEFSDDNHEIISNETVNGVSNYLYGYGIGPTSSDKVLTICKKVPDRASYIRLCTNIMYTSYNEYQCLYVKNSGLGAEVGEIWSKIQTMIPQITQLREYVDGVYTETLELGFDRGNLFELLTLDGFINNNGEVVSDANWKHSDYISVTPNSVVCGILFGYETDLVTTVEFSDENHNIIDDDSVNCEKNIVYKKFLNYGTMILTIAKIVPENAAYIRFCADISRTEDNKYQCLYLKTNGLSAAVGEIEKEKKWIKNLSGKKIFLYGDSISSTDYTWYKEYMEKYSGAIVYNQGLSGGNINALAQNNYFDRLVGVNPDIVICLLGGNDSGGSGTVGTFSENSRLYVMGESVVSETDINQDYNGNKFIQGVSHIMRKWKAVYFDFRLNANLSAKLVAASDTSAEIYVGTEKQCIEYAKSHNLDYGTGRDYYILCTETETSKRNKLMNVPHPKLIMLTTLKQQRNNDPTISSPESWERKRLAVIECCEKYDIPYIDTTLLFNIDMSQEPVFPGMNKVNTDVNDNQGVYTMDGLHPNEFGYEYLSRIILNNINV